MHGSWFVVPSLTRTQCELGFLSFLSVSSKYSFLSSLFVFISYTNGFVPINLIWFFFFSKPIYCYKTLKTTKIHQSSSPKWCIQFVLSKLNLHEYKRDKHLMLTFAKQISTDVRCWMTIKLQSVKLYLHTTLMFFIALIDKLIRTSTVWTLKQLFQMSPQKNLVYYPRIKMYIL